MTIHCMICKKELGSVGEGSKNSEELCRFHALGYFEKLGSLNGDEKLELGKLRGEKSSLHAFKSKMGRFLSSMIRYSKRAEGGKKFLHH